VTTRWTYPEDFDPRWTPRFPEVAVVANAVSLAMPHVEPFVIRAVRRVDELITDDRLRGETQRFIREEASHHAEHRRFNNLVTAHYAHLGLLERAIGATMRWLDRRSARLGTGFAAGFELAGLAVAMWLAPRAELLFRDADPVAQNLFLWHLGEEIEHRNIAHDVHLHTGGGWFTYAVGLILAMVVLGMTAFIGAATMLIADGRWYRPVAWWRLLTWGIGFLWSSGPMLLASLWRHPSAFLVPGEADDWGNLKHGPKAGDLTVGGLLT
jgi:uncharacterized protein